MYCRDCGEKLTLRFLENEGLVPYCEKCEKFKFPFFPVAVSMTVVNKAENKILLAKHAGDETFKLFAGYVKKGESVEKAIPRELKEETNLAAIKWRFFGSRFHDAKNAGARSTKRAPSYANIRPPNISCSAPSMNCPRKNNRYSKRKTTPPRVVFVYDFHIASGLNCCKIKFCMLK